MQTASDLAEPLNRYMTLWPIQNDLYSGPVRCFVTPNENLGYMSDESWVISSDSLPAELESYHIR